MKAINWLLTSEPYIEYATRKNLMNQDEDALADLKKQVLDDNRIKKLLSDVADFNGTLVTNHKNPELPIHKLLFLMDIGLNREVAEIDRAIVQILTNKDENGVYKSLTNVPKHYGGTGEDSLGWSFCDAPLMLLALVRGGISYQEQVKQGVDYLVGLQRDNGFPCTVSKELGKFRGPGKKSDPCPYANLAMLRLFLMISDYTESEAARISLESLLVQWENSWESHPYMFYMGTDFRKLKAPTLWFDLVAVTDCLSQYTFALKDRRFQEMIDILEVKANDQYQFTSESIYLKCKPWDFGQKKKPSLWLTYLCLNILKRCGRYGY
nr:hypothetical protein [uncultured Acetobacterium sp.]